MAKSVRYLNGYRLIYEIQRKTQYLQNWDMSKKFKYNKHTHGQWDRAWGDIHMLEKSMNQEPSQINHGFTMMYLGKDVKNQIILNL